VGLTVCFSGTYSALAIFWATAAQLIPRRSHAVGIALVSTVGTIASIISPAITGILRDLTQSFTAGAWYAAALLIVGVTLMAALSRRQAARAVA
jgi:MFS-type transporter involved in bile tolerance (Atg22 family)